MACKTSIFILKILISQIWLLRVVLYQVMYTLVTCTLYLFEFQLITEAQAMFSCCYSKDSTEAPRRIFQLTLVAAMRFRLVGILNVSFSIDQTIRIK